MSWYLLLSWKNGKGKVSSFASARFQTFFCTFRFYIIFLHTLCRIFLHTLCRKKGPFGWSLKIFEIITKTGYKSAPSGAKRKNMMLVVCFQHDSLLWRRFLWLFEPNVRQVISEIDHFPLPNHILFYTIFVKDLGFYSFFSIKP